MQTSIPASPPLLRKLQLLFTQALQHARFKRALIGRATSVDFIPPRPYMRRDVLDGVAVSYPAWSAPFWSITLETMDGRWLHACLDPRGAPPDLGAPVSFIASKPWPWREVDRIESLISPPTPIF